MSVLVVGGMGGIGRALIEALLKSPESPSIFASYNSKEPDLEHPRLSWIKIDVTDENSVANAAQEIPSLKWIINCVGILHNVKNSPEKALSRFDPEFFAENIRTNTLPTLLLAKHFSKHLKGDETSIFATVSAKVGSIEDNGLGGWYSYRMSKAALNMGLKNLSIEWKRTHKNVCVAALHPGTTDTALSKPFQRGVESNKLFSPEKTAGYLLDVLERLTPGDTGQFWSWNGEVLPW